MTQRIPTQRMLAAAVMQQAWAQGERRVRLFCADELRPAACCIVDALHARGYEVSLLTGPEARIGLQQPASAEILRVIWAPEGTDKQTRSRLKDALDPDAAGDVMILASATPRGVIDAIDAFGTPRRRSRIKGALAKKTFLAQPTLMELDRGAKGWFPAAAAAAVVAAFVAGGVSMQRGEVTHARVERPAATESMSPPKRDEPVLASGRAAVDLDFADDDEEPIILENEPVRARPKRSEAAVEDLVPAPIETATTISVAAPIPTVAVGMPMGGMPVPKRPVAIDPFE